jgi:peptidoglycan/xylan/chitin deacetylase (PgdA/CDA1 family)
MLIRQTLGAIRWRTISAFSRREFPLPDSVPTVSFTFDDFPRSALHTGGAILKSYGACGTYYAAMGLMGKVNHLGQHFSADDLNQLLSEGHELGSHTFSHMSCRAASVRDVDADVLKGRQAIEQITGIRNFHHFSYPYGHATVRVKPLIGRMMSSCRGGIPGINQSKVDLNLLRANSLYSRSLDLDSIERLLKSNEKCGGWLIFYTHDVSDTPSLFGCRPRELDRVVKLATTTRNRILQVGRYLPGIEVGLQPDLPIGYNDSGTR